MLSRAQRASTGLFVHRLRCEGAQETVEEHVQELLRGGVSVSAAAKQAAAKFGMRRKVVYPIALAMHADAEASNGPVVPDGGKP